MQQRYLRSKDGKQRHNDDQYVKVIFLLIDAADYCINFS
jgi:hypothetical protein